MDEILPARAHGAGSADGVGAFRQGDEVSRWALSRYLVARAIAQNVNVGLYLLGLLVLLGAAAVLWAGSVVLAVLLALAAVVVLGMRALLATAIRGLSGAALVGPDRARLTRLVADTRGDVRRELRRIGLPSYPWTMPLLAVRFTGRRRADALRRLRQFDVDRVVPPARVDDLHLLLQAVPGH